MTATKQPKNKKQRGHHTHGWGSKKKHRGAGHRGGRGNAGSGKRGDAKKPTFLKDKKYQLKNKGFTSQSKKLKAINLEYLENNIEKLAKAGLASSKDGAFEFDLTKIKFQKLLSQGKLTKKIIISAGFASKKAIEKVESAGGKVTLTKSKPLAEKKDEKAKQKKS